MIQLPGGVLGGGVKSSAGWISGWQDPISIKFIVPRVPRKLKKLMQYLIKLMQFDVYRNKCPVEGCSNLMQCLMEGSGIFQIVVFYSSTEQNVVPRVPMLQPETPCPVDTPESAKLIWRGKSASWQKRGRKSLGGNIETKPSFAKTRRKRMSQHWWKKKRLLTTMSYWWVWGTIYYFKIIKWLVWFK